MGRLTTLLATQFNSAAFPAGRYYAIRGDQMVKLVDSTTTFGYSSLIVNKLDGSQPDFIVAASAASAVRGQLNTANTTNSCNEIVVTVINDQTGATESVNLPVASIHLVWADPLNIARSYLALEDTVGQYMTNYHLDHTVQAVVTLANA